MKPIRDLDWETDIRDIARFTDTGPQRSATESIVRIVRTVCLALAGDVRTLAQVTFAHPLVQVLVRLAHHPDWVTERRVMPAVWLDDEVDAGPHLGLLAVVADARWDAAEVQSLLVRYLTERHGDVLVDDTAPPWLRDWGAAAALASTLIFIVALRAADARHAFLSTDERVEAAVAVVGIYSAEGRMTEVDRDARRRGFLLAFVDGRSDTELASLAARLVATFAVPITAVDDARAVIERVLDHILAAPS